MIVKVIEIIIYYECSSAWSLFFFSYIHSSEVYMNSKNWLVKNHSFNLVYLWRTISDHSAIFSFKFLHQLSGKDFIMKLDVSLQIHIQQLISNPLNVPDYVWERFIKCIDKLSTGDEGGNFTLTNLISPLWSISNWRRRTIWSRMAANWIPESWNIFLIRYSKKIQDGIRSRLLS